MKTTTLADAKAHLSEIINSAETTHERTTITKNGRPAAVLLSVEDLESIELTLENLADREVTLAMAESEITSRHGLYYEQDEMWDGKHAYSPNEQEKRLIKRMGQDAYQAARAAIRLDLLASDDAALRERARYYEAG